MCEAGRVRHHLKHNLWRAESTILFVGYQSNGTLGRKILEGAREVKLFNEPIDVRAQVRQFRGLSGHADKNGMISWLSAFENKPQKVFVVHGEEDVAGSFAECLRSEYGQDAYAPYSGTVYDLIANEFIYEAQAVRREKKAKTAKTNPVYERLEAAGNRLMNVIRNAKELANKDLAKFADQINALCDKWQ